MFYSKDEATSFNAGIADGNNLKFFSYKAKLLIKAVVDIVNGIFRDTTVAVPLKYLSNFWKSLEMSLINCKVKLKLKRTKYCVLAAGGADNADANSNKIISITKDTKLNVPTVSLSAKDNQKLSNLLSKGFERSVYWNI